jgi:predicted RNA-binding protein YlqC (UPF0109 family)
MAAAPPSVGGAFVQVVTIPASTVGKIIGKGGSTLRSLQDRFRCVLAVPRTVPGSTGSVEVTVNGHDLSSVQAAVNAVLALTTPIARVEKPPIDHADVSSVVSGSVSVKFSAVGRVIGRGGNTIRELQATSGCRIVVPSTPDASDASSATVQVSGPTKDAVDSVIARISALTLASGAGGDTGRGLGASTSSAHVSVPGSAPAVSVCTPSFFGVPAPSCTHVWMGPVTCAPLVVSMWRSTLHHYVRLATRGLTLSDVVRWHRAPWCPR